MIHDKDQGDLIMKIICAHEAENDNSTYSGEAFTTVTAPLTAALEK